MAKRGGLLNRPASFVLEVSQGGVGQLVCCGEPMELLDEKTADAATEKHVPVIAKVEAGYKVKVGSACRLRVRGWALP